MTMSPDRPAARIGVRRRDVLVVVLTVTTGALDAVSYLRPGKVFSSVITSNLVLLGVAAGERLAGTPRRGQPVWPVQVTVTLGAELAALAAFSAGWLAAGGHPAGAGLGAVTALLSPYWVPAIVLVPLAPAVVVTLAARRDRPVVTREGSTR
jgi:Protein of unknown function (DUF1275)